MELNQVHWDCFYGDDWRYYESLDACDFDAHNELGKVCSRRIRLGVGTWVGDELNASYDFDLICCVFFTRVFLQSDSIYNAECHHFEMRIRR